MSEPTDNQIKADPEPGRAVAVRERMVTTSNVAIWDSADFEQMQRVGVVLARSGLVPETLCKGKWIDQDTGKEVEGYLSEQVVAARCVLICNQARLWGADPLNVLQCTSLINGRLMYEGKLVNAIVQHLTGVKLRFELGRWDTDHYVSVPKEELSGLGERLAIRCYDPKDEEREVSGSAGMWKTTRAGNPWSNVGNWPRQLRYRAAREWARAYEPGAILGILAEGDQEIEQITAQPTGPGLMARLPGNQHGEGFDPENGAGTTEEARANVSRRRASRKAAAALPPPVDDPAATQAPEGGERPTTAEEPTGTETAPNAEPEPDTPASASAAPEASPPAEEVSGQTATAEPTSDGVPEGDDITVGYPAADEVYMLNGDEWVFDAKRGEDRRDTYKNGEPFSDAGRGRYAIYEDHPPGGGANDPQQELNETLSRAAQAAPEPEAKEQEDEPSFPPEFEAYIKVTETAESWPEIKTAMAALQKTPCWAAFTNETANHVRGTTWATLSEREVEWLPDPKVDVSAFRLWVEDCARVYLIKETLEALKSTPEWPSKPETMRNGIEAAAAARIAILEA